MLSYLQKYEPDELVRISNNTYTTRTHDSLKISNGLWMWWSHGVGGKNAINYLMTVKGMTFVEAVSVIAKDEAVINKTYIPPKKEEMKLILPKKASDNNEIINFTKGHVFSVLSANDKTICVRDITNSDFNVTRIFLI